MEKKYYWLKLNKDFFKRHDIRIIEAMPNGKDYVLFYLKLLVESVSHDGMLRFSDAIPYEENMLATITNTNVDIVRSAIRVFTELRMVEVLDDMTIFMTEVAHMTGCETKWAEKKRNYRNKIGRGEDNVLSKVDNVRQEKELEIEKEIETDNKDIVATFAATPADVKFPTGCFEMLCVETLIHSCLESFPNSRIPSSLAEKEKWAVEIERMKRLDKRKEEEIKQALQYAIEDPFWKSNIRSAKKFREKFEVLYVQSQKRRKLTDSSFTDMLQNVGKKYQ